MQRTFLSQLIGATALSLGLMVLPSSLPASAQTTTAPADPVAPTAPTDPTFNDPTLNDPATSDPNTAAPLNTADPDDVEGDRDFDWGWLGLLGLIGLAGLARKNEEPVTRYREPDEASSTTTRY